MYTEKTKLHGSGRTRLRPHTTTSGVLLASAAVPLAIVDGTASSFMLASPWVQAGGVCVGLLFLVAGLTITRRSYLGRILATLAVLGSLGLASTRLLQSPLATLAALVLCTTSLALLWKLGAPLVSRSSGGRRPANEGQAQGAALVAAALWVVWAFADVGESWVHLVVLGWAIGASVALAIEWGIRHLRAVPVRAAVLLSTVALTLAAVPFVWQRPWWTLSTLTLASAVAALVVRRPLWLEIGQNSWWEPLLGHPERLFVGTFAGLSFAGTALLALPQSAASGQSIGFTDAIFTATSAVCVTGLIVLDTPVDFSPFGQGVILVLIQVGGLGIMTFSTAVLWALGHRMSLRHEGAVASLISTRDRGRLFTTAKRVLQFTMWTEAAGAMLLTAAFMQHGDSLGTALWRGLFTAISAFCNAGFALQTESLVPYQQSPWVLHSVGLLIVLGGLSPLAVFALRPLVTRPAQPVSAQAKLSLVAAAALLVLGFLFFLTFEWNDSLAGLPAVDRFHNAWFQSVTLRTAGFNSVDLTVARPATLTLMLLWMFIGGSPGGTAGGVKTTTIAVLVLSVVAAIRGQEKLDVFGKHIAERTRGKAAVTVALAAATGVVALVAIQLTQPMVAKLAVFEVVSALGTVGLSIGGTAQLDGIGKAIIIICMFVGRVGGLTLLMFLHNRRPAPSIGRPEEQIDVG